MMNSSDGAYSDIEKKSIQVVLSKLSQLTRGELSMVLRDVSLSYLDLLSEEILRVMKRSPDSGSRVNSSPRANDAVCTSKSVYFGIQ